jgi:hypothetical protein
MLRQIQEEGLERSIVNVNIVGEALCFTISAFSQTALPGHDEIDARIVGERAKQHNCGLHEEDLGFLGQRNWNLPQEAGNDCPFPYKRWYSITSDLERRDVASELMAVARELYGVSPGRSLAFELRLARPTDELV